MNWILLPKFTEEYCNGVKAFVRNGFAHFGVGDELKCPCKDCGNRFWQSRDDVFDHLIFKGPYPSLVDWIYEISTHKYQPVGSNKVDYDRGFGLGEDFDEMINNTYKNKYDTNGMTSETKLFYQRVEDGKQPLYPGSKLFTRLSFIVKLYELKCTHGFTEAAFSGILELIKEAFPEANLPSSFRIAKKMITDLGLNYEKIHACPNDCMLYWAEDKNANECKVCGISRWKELEIGHNNTVDYDQEVKRRIPAKVMRYFPLKPRLQRLFMCKEYSELMTWHSVGRTKDGMLRHPADAEGWKSMDERHPNFAREIRNVRLGLAADGFNPYRSMNISHSTWPIVLVNYNLPPSLIMKPENLILSTIIPGPIYPGNEIDVYMQPLITELKELWGVGIETYDAFNRNTFTLRASLLWTISDFPGYGVLSGWSTKGKLGCPVCHYCTSSTYLKHSRKVCYMNHRKFLPSEHALRSDKKKFNGEIESDLCPPPLFGEDIEELLCGYENNFGKGKKSKKAADCPWKKKSIFFELPYWSGNLIRHNLDVMHIEKNVCDKILGTLLNMGGKTKDHLNARLDLQEMGIRKVLHPVTADNIHYEYAPASFDMTKTEKKNFCSVLKNARLPYGSASNISRCVHVEERKVFGYKSHDAHFILQYLLQFAVIKTLQPEVAVPLIRLGGFFRGICGKVINLEDVQKLQEEIIEILCELETIFPPAFFDIMVHLPVHLCKEVEFGGPVHLRWMFGIERYLCRLKSYVRNRSKPEGSMAEGYLVEECLTFCSRFLNDDVKKKKEEHKSNVSYPIGSRRNKTGRPIDLVDKIWTDVHRYILFNCGNEEIEKLIEEHRSLCDNGKLKRYRSERSHTKDFPNWLKEVVAKKKECSVELLYFAKGPLPAAKKYTGYVINGFRFHTRKRDIRCTTQNSGVFLTALTTSFASSKDQNPVVGEVSYYGAIEEIIEVDYWGALAVVLFKCCWYQKDKDCCGLTRVNFNKLHHKNDPFVLATQVEQVFYIQDCTEHHLYYVVKKSPSEYVDKELESDALEEVTGPTMHDTNIKFNLENRSDEVIWYRDDLPRQQVRVTTLEQAESDEEYSE